ncbi:protein PAL OF QUIRKY [Rosa sericea]
MTSLHPSEMDTDSVASTPRSDHPSNDQTRVRFMCSFGGKILPRPHDNQLRYVGGDTRIVAVQRATTYGSLLSKLAKLSGLSNVTVKYQLPNEDLDALISVTTDEDVDNMIDEYDRITQNQNPKAARLRLFLFPKGDDDSASRTSSISSLLDGSAKREHWFLDALNSGASNASILERGRSEASSILSEVPDYLFGLDNSDDTHNREFRAKTRPGILQDNVSASDPGSPAPVISSPFCSTSSNPSVPPLPNLPPVKTKPDSKPETRENQSEGFAETTAELPVSQATGFSGNPGNPGLHYIQDPNYPGHVVRSVPVYYYPAPVQPANVPVQQVQIRTPYMPQQYQALPGQIPVGYHNQIPGMGQVYGGGLRPVAGMDQYDVSGRVVSDGVNQQVYYGVRNGGVVPGYNPARVVQSGEEWQGNGSDINAGRAPNGS